MVDLSQRVLTIHDIEHHHWRRSESEIPVGLSATHTHLSLAAAVELACIEQADKHLQLSDMKVRLPDCPIWQLIKAARWGDRRTRSRLSDGSRAAFVLPQEANDAWWLQSLQNLILELEANAFPPHLARALTGAVAEMVDNIWIHSESPRAGLLVYQLRRRKFAFSVADLGVGILATLRKNPRYKTLTSSMDAIRLAVEPKVSQFEGIGGMGFPSLLNALADLWGTVRLRSGEAALVIDRKSEKRTKSSVYLPQLQGVHIAVRCSLDRPRFTA